MTPERPLHRVPNILAATLLAVCLLWGSPAASQEDPEALFGQAVELFQAEEYRDAVEIFRQVFELDPNPFVLFNIGRCYHQLGELETAAKYYDRSLALDGLPREAKVEAIKRLDDIQIALEHRRSKDGAVDRVHAALDTARSELTARVAVMPPETGEGPNGPEKGAGRGTAPTPPEDEGGRGTLTWVGVGLGVIGLAAVGGGTWFALQVNDDLDRHSGLVADYTALEAQALASADSELATQALSMADEANALAGDIEQDQRLGLALFAAGGAMVIGGVVMILADTPDEPDVTVIATPNGLAVVGLW